MNDNLLDRHKIILTMNWNEIKTEILAETKEIWANYFLENKIKK